MPSFCAVVGCGSRGNRDKNSFFRIPCIPIKGQPEMIALKTERRMKWILALRRKDLTESKLKYASICDRHFISGRPAATRDIYNPDWVPNQNMGYDTRPSSEYRNQTTTKAIICYLTPSVQQQIEEEGTESEEINQDEGCQTRTESPSDIQVDQDKKQENNGNAIICYLRTANPKEMQAERTEYKTNNQHEDS